MKNIFLAVSVVFFKYPAALITSYYRPFLSSENHVSPDVVIMNVDQRHSTRLRRDRDATNV